MQNEQKPTQLVYNHNRWEVVDSKLLKLCKQIAPDDWWIEYDNIISHKYNIAIQCIARLEERYFKEWIEHHLKIGIEHIYIYDNNDEEGLEKFLRSQLSAEDFSKIEVISWRHPMEFQQFSALEDCVIKHRNDIKWLLSLDLDEFLFLKKPLKELLKEFFYASEVFFSWESIGADGQLNYEDKPITERFKKRFDCTDGKQGKIIFRPERLKRWNVHGAELLKGKTVNVLHEEIIAPDSFANIFQIAWVKHYFTKSLEEWEWKIQRGCADACWCRRYNMFFEINPDLIAYKNLDFQLIQKHGIPRKKETAQ